MNNIENDDFYKGYAARDKVAKEICSKCIYMKKDRQKYKTYKGMLQKQNKIIDAMAEEFMSKTLMFSDMTKQEIREYFEKRC